MGKSQVDWASHMPLLVRMLDKTEGDVLEMGTGHFSTAILRWICELSGRTLYSYESKARWYGKAVRKAKSFNKVIFCSNWDYADIERDWGLVFIDHNPNERRHVDIKRLVNHAKIIVVHDTEPEGDRIYRYSQVFPLFKYRIDYTKYKPWTSAVSNFVDLSKIA